MNNNYVVYHLHSDLSLLDSTTKYEDYVKKAYELGQTALASTEHGNIYNWTEKKRLCERYGIKYIHGCEVYLTESLFHKRQKDTGELEDYKIRDNYHTVLLAKNYNGVKELNSLISLSTQPDHFYYKPRITFDEFLNISDNIIKISACLANPIARLENRIANLKLEIKELKENFENKTKEINEILSSNKEQSFTDDLEERYKYELYNNSNFIEYKEKEYKNLVKYWDKLLQHYDYYEIQYHNVEEQILYNKKLYELSKQYNKPLIVGTDTHSLNPYKAECRLILQKAKTGTIFGTSKSKGADFTDIENEFDLTYKSYDELVEMFRIQNSLSMETILEAIDNTNIMADSVEDFDLDTSIKYPHMYDNDEEVFLNKINQMFNEKIEKGIIPLNQKEEFEKRIDEEIRVFKKLDMIGFMLSMHEICSWAKENGHPLGVSRGSVGGSCVAYVTDITDLNPVQWNTIFSRFCNESRKEIGDIDIDCYKDDRPFIYDYIINRFGQEKTAYVLAIGTVSDKGTIDEIGRALEYPLDKVKEIKIMYEENSDKCKEKYSELFYYFDGINGTAVSQSMHPAGIIASPITLSDNYGTFLNDNMNILCLDMDAVHEVGLSKYDILG